MYNALESIQAFQVGQGQRKERERERTMKGIGNALAGGNYAGGAGLAYSMGDIGTGMQLTQMGKGLQDAEAEKKRQGLMRYGMGLLQTPMEQREAMRPQIAQSLAQIGVELPPDQLQSMDLSDAAIQATLQSLQDPETLLAQYYKEQEPYTLGPDQVRMRGDQEIARGPVKGPDLPAGMQMGPNGPEWIPGYLEAQERLRKAGASSVNVSTGDQKGENKFQEGLGSQAADSVGTILQEGRAASASIGNLDTMDALLDQIDYTGFGGDTLLQVQRVGSMFGIEIPDLPAKEAAKRLSSQMALSLKQDLPGPMSNADREFLLSIPPNLNSTQAGNDAIIFILRKREQRKQDMMRSLLEADPQSMQEYRAWENRYLQETPPMFTPATQESLLRALSGASGEDSPQ